jgi:hypothetical protein
MDGIHHPIGLPQGQLTAAGADTYGFAHYWPQPAQLLAVHPPQDEDDVLVVCPPAPLEMNPQVDMSLQTFELLQSGHSGVSLPKTSFSNWQPHPSHWYSKIGIWGLLLRNRRMTESTTALSSG